MQICITKATPSDFPKIIPLWKEMILFHYQRDKAFQLINGAEKIFEEYLKSCLQNSDNNILLLAETDNTPICYCFAKISNRPPIFEKNLCGVITDIAVTDKFRRTGIGSLLFKGVKEWFSKKEINLIQLDISAVNEVSRAFWQRMGFKPYMITMSLED